MSQEKRLFDLSCGQYGTDGFLRWALDAFNDDPLVSSAHRILQPATSI